VGCGEHKGETLRDSLKDIKKRDWRVEEMDEVNSIKKKDSVKCWLGGRTMRLPTVVRGGWKIHPM